MGPLLATSMHASFLQFGIKKFSVNGGRLGFGSACSASWFTSLPCIKLPSFWFHNSPAPSIVPCYLLQWLSASSSSPPNSWNRKCDVFISFRGFDTRSTIVSHLYHALLQKCVNAFKDSPGLEVGERRSELFDAIKGSSIAVVVFSKDYARSWWCLEELREIMEQKERQEIVVLPVFYRVTPHEVRMDARACHENALMEIAAKHGEDLEKVKRWRKALCDGGDLIGFCLSQGEDEGNVVQEIVKRILKILDRVPLEVAKHPVGITSRLEEVKPLLHIDSGDAHACMVGIHGPAGVGKTTLSKAILNEYAGSFDGWCFLANVREISGVSFNGLAVLQQKLLRELLGQVDLTVSNVDEGKVLIRERLCHKRVIAVLDDVDRPEQLDSLAGNLDWFGKGSRIIVTTRDGHLLTNDRVQEVYEVRLLDKADAGNLFRSHAFYKGSKHPKIDNLLVDSFLVYANRLPLALVVLGEFLKDRSADEWKSMLVKLEKNPNNTINSVLKISFDGLEDHEKEIFLDIACFFKGWDKDYVVKVLDGCGFSTLIGIRILVERCLLYVEGDKFQMHDLLEVMGKSIALEERDAGGSSRIWRYEDLETTLSDDAVAERKAVKGIVLDLSWIWKEQELVDVSNFKSLKRLRLLIVRRNIHLKRPLHLPSELRWFEWPGYSASTIDFSSSRKLVGIDMRSSNVSTIKAKEFEELKYLNLSHCESLEALPDLSKSSKLEDLILYRCKNLTILDEPIGSHDKLIHLDLRECRHLVKVPSTLKSRNFRTLNFSGCSKLGAFPTIVEELEFLHELSLERTAVERLPHSIGNLVAVKSLNLSNCKELSFIPGSIHSMRALKYLSAWGCSKLVRFPRKLMGDSKDALGLPNLICLNLKECNLKELEFLNDLTCFAALKELLLSGNDFSYVPGCISKFMKLEEVQICACEHLKEVPVLPPNVMRIYMNGCRRLKSFPGLHTFIGRTPGEIKVDLSNCHSLDPSYIDSLLPFENIQEIEGVFDVMVPGEEFPPWINFQTTDCYLPHRVTLPEGVCKDHILGFVLCVTFQVIERARYPHMVGCEINCYQLWIEDQYMHQWEMDHTWLIYLPRQQLFDDDKGEGFPWNMVWSNFTFHFFGKGTRLRRCGMSMIYKQGRDGGSFLVNPLRGSSFRSAMSSPPKLKKKSSRFSWISKCWLKGPGTPCTGSSAVESPGPRQ